MLRWLAILLVVHAAAGCTATGFLRQGGASQASGGETGTSGDSLDGQGLGVYLELMRLLVEGDALTQTENFRDVAEAADYAPTTTNRLKLALALSIPGHPGSDPALAEQRLGALLASPDALLPEERALVMIHLRDVEQRLILDAAAEQLRRESARALEQQNSESARRLQAALEENRRLRAELDDATQKLRALTTIEQSIRERENGPN